MECPRRFNNSAICLHLADSYGEGRLAPALGSAERARYYQAILYAASTGDDVVVTLYLQKTHVKDEERDHALVEAKTKQVFAFPPLCVCVCELWLEG